LLSAWAGLDFILFPHVAGMAGEYHHAQPSVGMGSPCLFTQLVLKWWSSLSPSPKSLGLQAWATAPSFLFIFFFLSLFFFSQV
jgi:hypothetical protein